MPRLDIIDGVPHWVWPGVGICAEADLNDPVVRDLMKQVDEHYYRDRARLPEWQRDW